LRKDLQKLLCEQERNGSSRRHKEVRRSKDFAVDPNEFSAGRESMTKRYTVKGINKEFSENFAPLWGIIRKNANRPWDKVFSELNEVFDMRNHVNAHILVHLWQFVERETYIGDDGKVWVRGRYNGDQQLESSGSEYYIHPITGLLLRNKAYKSWKASKREGAAKRAAKERKTRIVISNEQELRRKDEDSPWFVCTLALLVRPDPVYVWDERQYREGGKIYRSFRATYPRLTKKDKWTGEYAQYNRYYCSDYRSASKKEIKQWGAE
jgi:hypothetical protein